MLRRLHSLPGLFAALLIAALALTGAFLAFDSIVDRSATIVPATGQVSVAAIPARIFSTGRSSGNTWKMGDSRGPRFRGDPATPGPRPRNP